MSQDQRALTAPLLPPLLPLLLPPRPDRFRTTGTLRKTIMSANHLVASLLVAAFALQGCGTSTCEKMIDAQNHVHEASKSCEGWDEDYEPVGSFMAALCVLVTSD